MTEIINFIKGKGKLVSLPILTEFKKTYANKNDEILPQHAIQFVKSFNTDAVLIDDKNYIIRQKSILINSSQDGHMFYIYNNPNGMVEKWDSSTWQKTTNNTSLYAAFLAIIRPNCSFEQTKELIGKIIDKQNSEGARLLGEISLHFFARSQAHFRYPNFMPITLPDK